MNKEDLERITDGLAQGSGEAPNGHNLVGAANAIANILEPLEEYDALTLADLPQEDIDALGEAQTDLQYLNAELGTLIGSMTGNDGSVTLPDGTTVDLPNEASVAGDNVDLPDSGGSA